MTHYISPSREHFFRFVTGSDGPFDPDGSMDMWSVKNYLVDNAEWIMATGVPQTRINWLGKEKGMTLPTDILLHNKNNLVYSEGPFMLNLTPEGDTMPLFTKVNMKVFPLTGSNDSNCNIMVHLRQMGPRGKVYSDLEIGTFRVTSSDYQWYEVEGAIKDLSGNSRHMLQAPRSTLKLDYPLRSRTSRSLDAPNTVVKVPLFYIDVWADVDVTGANQVKRINVAGMYCQETSLSGNL